MVPYYGPPQPQRSQSSILFVLLGVVLLLGGAIVMLGGVGLPQESSAIVGAPAPVLDRGLSKPVVLGSIQKLGQQQTATLPMMHEVVVKVEAASALEKALFGNRAEMTVLLYADARAGIDFEKITADRIVIRGHTVEIQLPDSELFEIVPDVERSHATGYHESFLAGASRDQINNLTLFAMQQGKSFFQRSACESTLLKAAADNAEAQVGNLFTQLQTSLSSATNVSDIKIVVVGSAGACETRKSRDDGMTSAPRPSP